MIGHFSKGRMVALFLPFGIFTIASYFLKVANLMFVVPTVFGIDFENTASGIFYSSVCIELLKTFLQ
jgi:hypothetical protein